MHIPKSTLLLVITILFAPIACANNNHEEYKREAQAYCDIHKPEYWKDRESYSAIDNLEYLGKRTREVVKSEAFLKIFDKLAQQGYDDFYKAIQPEISRLIGEEWQCEYARKFYAIQWVRQGEPATPEAVETITITAKGTIEHSGKTYTGSGDASYKTVLAGIAKTGGKKILLRVPAGTDSAQLESYLKPMRESKIKTLSVQYY